MKLLHLADIHLDRAFAGSRDGARRRAGLRDALVRGLELGAVHGVDAICLAGDVYEHETVTQDTAGFLASRLGAAGVPVLVSPGNHDPYLPGSVWARTAWPGNVHVFSDDRLEPCELHGATVWGAAFTARHCSTSCLDGWEAPGSGAHLLLLHGALTGEQWADEPAHRPLTRAALAACGAAYAMLGHFHQGRGDGLLCYPGSPEPLTFGERDGNHGAALIEVSDAGVSCQLVPLARRLYAAETLRVDGAGSADHVEAAVAAAAARHQGTALEVTLEGDVDPGCEIASAALEERCGGGLEELRVRDRTRPAYDLAAIAGERSVRGRFVARLIESPEPHAREALLAGLRAMDRRRDLVA